MPINQETGEYYTLESPMPPPAPANGSDVVSSIGEFFNRFATRPVATDQGVSGQLYNAIYAFGAGKLDLARERAAKALLASRTGSQFVSEVERQRIMQWLPLVFVVVGVLLILFIWRR